MIGALLLTPCSHRTCALLGCVCPPIVGRFLLTYLGSPKHAKTDSVRCTPPHSQPRALRHTLLTDIMSLFYPP